MNDFWQSFFESGNIVQYINIYDFHSGLVINMIANCALVYLISNIDIFSE